MTRPDEDGHRGYLFIFIFFLTKLARYSTAEMIQYYTVTEVVQCTVKELMGYIMGVSNSSTIASLQVFF